jgi:filamentous hemagglutinin family protein
MSGSNQGWCVGSWTLGVGTSLVLGGLVLFGGDYAHAQITPDNTLGKEASVVKPNVNIKGQNSDLIEGGATRGANLFHSFSEFNVGEGRGAYFANPDGIQNIFSRVRGTNLSDIRGTLGVNGSANLFLLNPNGIIFGPNAKLDMGGSFLGSTANSIKFADGFELSASATDSTRAPTDSQQTDSIRFPLLTISVPIGLQYGGTSGGIRVQGSSLQVQPGQTLALVGGNVSMNGGSLKVPGGRVELGGLTGTGTVGLTVNGNDVRLSFPDSVPRADISLTQSALVDVTAGGGGSIHVNAGNLNILENSVLLAGIGQNLGLVGSVAGDIEINATGTINLANKSFIINTIVINTQPQPQPEPLPEATLPPRVEPKCQVGSQPRSNKFTVIGSAGLPLNPSQTINNNRGWEDFRSETPGTENSSSSPVDIKPIGSAPKQIVEAQGWIINDKGQVELVAVAPQATLSQQTLLACDSQSEKVAQN